MKMHLCSLAASCTPTQARAFAELAPRICVTSESVALPAATLPVALASARLLAFRT
jgi:hypothetical protein